MPVLLLSSLAFSYYLDAGYQPSVNWWAPLLALMGVCGLRPLRLAVPALALAMAVVVNDGVTAGLPTGVVLIQALLAPPLAALISRSRRRTAKRNAELRRVQPELTGALRINSPVDAPGRWRAAGSLPVETKGWKRMKATRMARVVAVAGAALSMVALAVSPASATVKKGCPYPYVCFYVTATDYNNNHPTWMYSGWDARATGVGGTGADYVVNTRNDDTVRLTGHTSTGEAIARCLAPNGTAIFSYREIVTGLDINDASSC
ncbi:hypothetical protein KCMC57_up55970 [Kitasatospora sp. CMC57]|uniref:Uncharacterized protein n=1 Tax=Kitasatospora sp. CMC57 TaxID=3231513 RepID=A0AB33K349_9ACTN